MAEDAAWTARTTLQSVQARSNVPDRHQPTPLVLLTAKGRYSNEPQSFFSKSKVSLAGIVRVAKYFRISEWTAISRSGPVLEAALKWINQADLHGDDYWHHYYKILCRKRDPCAKEFLLGMPATVFFFFPSTYQLEFLMQEWQDNAVLLRRLTEELDHAVSTRVATPPPTEHTKHSWQGPPTESRAATFEHSPPCVQELLPPSPPQLSDPAAQLTCPGYLSRATAISGPLARLQCRDSRMDIGRGTLLGSALACHGTKQMAAYILQPPQLISASLTNQRLWGKDEMYEPNTPTVDPEFHWPSEQVFYRIPAVIPYDSPIFEYVQNGDISGVRELWRQGQASVDVVDPYGLGLLYVRSCFPSVSRR